MEDQTNPQTPPKDPALAGLDTIANLMDNQFRIPGTNFRFGFDSILGLIPGVGDGIGLAVSGYLMTVMIRRGAGPILMLRMLGNVLLDAAVGVVPFVGDIFDFGFKANRRNVELLKKYYASGQKRPSTKWSIALLLLLFLAVFVLMVWGIFKFSAWVVGQF